jgi:hypothetical protein
MRDISAWGVSLPLASLEFAFCAAFARVLTELLRGGAVQGPAKAFTAVVQAAPA